jgi:hypothetical protein
MGKNDRKEMALRCLDASLAYFLIRLYSPDPAVGIVAGLLAFLLGLSSALILRHSHLYADTRSQGFVWVDGGMPYQKPPTKEMRTLVLFLIVSLATTMRLQYPGDTRSFLATIGAGSLLVYLLRGETAFELDPSQEWLKRRSFVRGLTLSQRILDESLLCVQLRRRSIIYRLEVMGQSGRRMPLGTWFFRKHALRAADAWANELGLRCGPPAPVLAADWPSKGSVQELSPWPPFA